MWILRATLMVLVLHYSSTETNHLIKWQILNPPIVFGQDVVLFCNASLAKKCCMNTATWMKGFDVIVHHRASTNVSKYIHKKQRNGFLLIIKNFDEDDINQQYTCLYDFSSYSAVLGIDRHNFKYIPNEDELDTNIKKISDNTFVADVIFLKVYPLPECILVRNQKKINTNVTVGEETKIGHFYKIKLHLVYKIHNNNCMDSVAVLCTIGKDEIVVYNNKISNCSDINDSLGSDKNSLDHNILVVFILSCLFLLATFTAACMRMWKKRRLSSRTTFSRIEGSIANSTKSDNRSVRFWKKEGNDYDEDSELTPLLERDSGGDLLSTCSEESRAINCWRSLAIISEVSEMMQLLPKHLLSGTSHRNRIKTNEKTQQFAESNRLIFRVILEFNAIVEALNTKKRIKGNAKPSWCSSVHRHSNDVKRCNSSSTPPAQKRKDVARIVRYAHLHDYHYIQGLATNIGINVARCRTSKSGLYYDERFSISAPKKSETLVNGPAQKGIDVIQMIIYFVLHDKLYIQILLTNTRMNYAREQRSLGGKFQSSSSSVPVISIVSVSVSVSDFDVIKGSSWIPTWGERKRSRISITGKQAQ